MDEFEDNTFKAKQGQAFSRPWPKIFVLKLFSRSRKDLKAPSLEATDSETKNSRINTHNSLITQLLHSDHAPCSVNCNV